MKSKWIEIKCDYLDEDPSDMFWRVDAWETDDDWEEGRVIAYIDDLTGRVVYADPDARWDEYALQVVADKCAEIKQRLEEKPKSPSYAVVFSYSFDDDCAAYLFETYDEAAAFLRDSYHNELRIDTEENGWQSDGEILEDGSHAAIATYFDDHVDVTEFRVANIYR